VGKVLLDDANLFATQAEGKAGTLMAQLITKSNTQRKRHKEKMAELQQVKEELKKSLQIHAIATKKSLQQCLYCGFCKDVVL